MKIKNEHLSAVFDDEAGKFEQRRLLDELEKDPALKQSWSNYALIGDVMREPDTAQVADPDFLSSMQLRLDEEDSYSNVRVKTQTKSKAYWLQPLSGVAIAATVAALSVFSMQLFMQDNGTNNSKVHLAHASSDHGGNTTPALIKTAAVSTNVIATAPPVSNIVTVQPQEQVMHTSLDERTKMQRYLASHIRNASRKTIAPTLRMISYNYY